MQAPRFWYRDSDWRALMLSPLGWLYGVLTAQRVAQRAHLTAKVPVICIGNLNAGGTGKTPTTIAIAQMLNAEGYCPHIVSRGYGGALDGPHQVAFTDTAEAVGDEPLLLAGFAPTWVAKKRSTGVKAAIAAGASHILMDDGFQNPEVAKDFSLIVVDAAKGFGNGRCIPAGPLREPVAAGLTRADMLLSIGPETDQAGFEERWGAAIPVDLPHLTGALEPLQTGYDFAGQTCLAFAGIGHPEKFFATLRSMGADLVRAVPLSDHQPLTPALIARMERDALHLGAQLVTTEKDAVRLPPAFRQKVITVPVRLRLEDEERLKGALTALG